MSDVHNLVLFKTRSLFTVLFYGSLRSVVQLHSLGSALSRGRQTGTSFLSSVSPKPFPYLGKLRILPPWAVCRSGLAWASLAGGCWGETGVCQDIILQLHQGFYKPEDVFAPVLTLVSRGLPSSDQVCYSWIYGVNAKSRCSYQT